MGSWKYLKIGDAEYLFNLDADERERANVAHLHPNRLSSLREAWSTWDAALPPIPADARYFKVYGSADMPQSAS